MIISLINSDDLSDSRTSYRFRLVIAFPYTYISCDHHCGWAVGPMVSHWLGVARRSPVWVSHWLHHRPSPKRFGIWLPSFLPKTTTPCYIYLTISLLAHSGVRPRNGAAVYKSDRKAWPSESSSISLSLLPPISKKNHFGSKSDPPSLLIHLSWPLTCFPKTLRLLSIPCLLPMISSLQMPVVVTVKSATVADKQTRQFRYLTIRNFLGKTDFRFGFSSLKYVQKHPFQVIPTTF